MKFCQTISWNSDHTNEVLPVCFVRGRIWKVNSCQFKLQILYCAIVLLSYKLFRLKLRLWLQSICFVTSPSSELRNSRAVKRKHDDFNSALDDWVCIYLSNIFTVRNALWYIKKLSLIYIVNCLNRGTDLNRLLIPLSQITKRQNQNMRVLWALWHFEKCLNIMIHRILLSTCLCYLNIFIVMNKSY